MNIISQTVVTDSRGVRYQKTFVEGKPYNLQYPSILRRISPRPVDTKRAARAAYKAYKLSRP